MFCTKCGAKVFPEEKICTICGATITPRNVPQNTPPPIQTAHPNNNPTPPKINAAIYNPVNFQDPNSKVKLSSKTEVTSFLTTITAIFVAVGLAILILTIVLYYTSI